MSKYDLLWKFFLGKNNSKISLSFEEIRQIAGVEIDHSFLSFKKDLEAFGYRVEKISLKEKTVHFLKVEPVLH